jgi:predicted dehydrogenase
MDEPKNGHHRFKVGIIGAGIVSTMHLEGLKNHPERVEITAICDTNIEALNEKADAYQINNRFTDLQEFIDKSMIDVAIVCTPSTLRKNILFPLIEAGIPVFCEKPFAETLNEAKEITEKSKHYEVPVSIDQNFRYFYSFHIIKQIIEQKELGNILSINLNDLTFRQVVGWRAESERNSMSVMGIHWFDGFRWILEAKPKSILCQTYSSPSLDCVGDTDGICQIEFNSNTTVQYRQSFSSPYRRNEIIIIGEQGALVGGYQSISLYKEDTQNTPYKVIENPYTGNKGKSEATFNSFNQLLLSIEQGVEATNSAEDNLKTMELFEGAYVSARKQSIITF